MGLFTSFSTLHYLIENTMITSPSLWLSPLSSSPVSHSLNLEMTITRRMGRFVRIIFTFTLATVGSLIGGVIGGVIGLSTETGLLRGAALGAISAALATIETIESFLSIWLTIYSQSTTWSFLNLVDIVFGLLSGRLVREKAGPNMHSAVQSQMDEVDLSLMDVADIFDIGGTEGLPSESIDQIPKISITSQNSVDATGERISCVVCLQDFEIGEDVRCLPRCQHIFHLQCIDGWLIRHGSCPLCRWNV